MHFQYIHVHYVNVSKYNSNVMPCYEWRTLPSWLVLAYMYMYMYVETSQASPVITNTEIHMNILDILQQTADGRLFTMHSHYIQNGVAQLVKQTLGNVAYGGCVW